MDERARIQEERDSTKQCLYICEWVSDRIDEMQTKPSEDISTASPGHRAIISTPRDYVPATGIADKMFKEWKEGLPETTSKLKIHFQEINHRLEKLPSGGIVSSSDYKTELARIQAQMDSMKQCLAICAQASAQAESEPINVFEDVSAAQGAHQVVASAKELISAKHVTAAARSTQWLVRCSDATLQQFSRDRSRVAVEEAAEETVEETVEEAAEEATESRGATVEEFKGRHGKGKRRSSGRPAGINQLRKAG